MYKLRLSKGRLGFFGLLSALLLPGSIAQAQNTLTNGLVAYWNFDSADFKDKVGIYDGTGNGAAAISFVPGKTGFGQAVQLNGSDQYVLITGGNPDDLAFPNGSISIAGWFRVAAFDKSWQALIAQGEGNSWRVARNNATSGMSYAGGLTDDLGTIDVTDGNWHHFVAITDASAAAFGTGIYIDGTLDGQQAGTPALATNGQRVRIGDNPGATGRNWNGDLDELAIWNRVLTESEIATLYNNGEGKPLIPPPAGIIIGGLGGEPAGFVIGVSDNAGATFDPTAPGAIVTFTFNGKAITPTSSNKSAAGVTTYRYTDPTSPITPGSVNTVVLVVKDSKGLTVASTNTFTGISYTSLDPASAATGVDKSKPGFTIRVVQTDFSDASGNPVASDVNTGVTIAQAERLLHGDFPPNTADLSKFTGPGGTYNETGVINYNAASGDIGTFPDPNAPNLPGLPGTAPREAGNDDVAMEIITYIEFPKAGSYRMIFGSDDGFRTTTAANPLEALNSKIVSVADLGRGVADTADWVYVGTPGIYPFRTVWVQGGGGANMEWSAITEDGAKILINDSATSGALKAYAVNNGPVPAAVSYVDPPRATGRNPGAGYPITVEITDGSTAVTNIKLNVNGADVTPTITKLAKVNKVVYAPTPVLPPNSLNTVIVSFTDGSTQYKGTNTFTTSGGVTIPPSMALKAADVNKSKPGFLIKTYQVAITNNAATTVNGLGNTTQQGEIYVHNWWGWPNTADLATFTGPGGSYEETGVINYNGSSGDTGIFPNDLPMPGIRNDNADLPENGVDYYALEIRTVLDLQPGTYDMGVNSDDGFRLIVGDGKEAFTAPPVAGEFNGGRGNDNWNWTPFSVQVTQAGLYPFRLVFEEGTGGNNIEWFQVLKPWYPTLINKVLIGDSAGGGIKAYEYPINSTGPTYVKSFSPGRSSSDSADSVGRAGTDATVSAVIVDGSTPVDKSTVTLKVNGAVVSPTVTQAAGQTTVSYKPAAGFAMGTTNTVEVGFTDRSFSWSFIVGLPTTPTFWIEAADFDYGSGQTKPEASTMPYSGGAYAGLSAVAGTDYVGGYDDDNPYYRYPNTLRVPVSIASDFDRGGGEVNVDFRLGWMGGAHWYNYTRTFPAGNYNVYAALSSGSKGDRIYGNLADVTGGANSVLGVFESKTITGGWGNNNLVPLKDTAATNTVVSLNLSGTKTLRYNDGSGDFDFLLFAPASSTPTGPKITGATIASGNFTVTWTGGGSLQSSADLKTWTDVPSSSGGSYSTAASAAHAFYRVKQ